MEERLVNADQEIELIDLLRILSRRRLFILLFTLLSVVAAGVVCVNMTKIFKVSMIMNTGFAGIDKNSKELNITTTDELLAIIKSGVYEHKIIDELYSVKDEKTPEKLDFVGGLLDRSNIMQVSCEIDDPSRGVKALTMLHAFLEEDYAPKVDTFIKLYVQESEAVKYELVKNESEINTIKNKILQEKINNKSEIAQIEHSISAAMQQNKTIIDKIDNAALNIETVEKEIAGTRSNTQSLIEKRDRYLEGAVDESKALSSLIFSNTVQQTIGYLNALIASSSGYYNSMSEEKRKLSENEKLIKDQTFKKKSLMDGLLITIENLNLNIKELNDKQTDLTSQINVIEFQKEAVRNIQMIEPPLVSKHPVKPKTLSIIVLSGLSALFVSVLIACFMGYLDGYRDDKKLLE